MTPPPISRDWWFAAALTGAVLPTAMAQTAAPGQPAQAGVITAVAAGAQLAGSNQVLQVGNNVLPGQRLRTDANGLLHILFLDQSALTLGPDSEASIEEFTYDPETRQGRIRVALNTGTLRIVGGHISKTSPAVVTTPQGQVEISGGISVVESNPQGSNATFLFGQQMRTTDNNGNSHTITRPGFGSSMGSSGTGQPQRVQPNQLSSLGSRFENRQSATPQPPSGSPGSPRQDGLPSPQLISTGNQPGGTQSPGQTLANDRLTGGNSPNPSAPGTLLQTVLGSGQTNIQS